MNAFLPKVARWTAMGGGAFAVSWYLGMLVAHQERPLIRSADSVIARTGRTVYMRGELTAEAIGRLHAVDFDDSSAVVLLLSRGRDWQTCEDLGRQLRDSQRAMRRMRWILWTDKGEGAELRRIMDSERIRLLSVQEVSGDADTE